MNYTPKLDYAGLEKMRGRYGINEDWVHNPLVAQGLVKVLKEVAYL